jgi:hypothetical protein
MSSQNDERPNARAREKRLGLASRPRSEDYREKYAKHFKMSQIYVALSTLAPPSPIECLSNI